MAVRAKLVNHGKGIYYADRMFTFSRVLGQELAFPIRMTAIQLNSGSVFLHSPFHPDVVATEEVDGLGSVKHIVAPNKFHSLWSPLWKEKYPEATLYACPDLVQKRKDVKWDVELTPTTSTIADWKDEIEFLVIEGLPALSEVVFFHKPSKTLLLTDLAFNHKKGHSSSWILRSYLALTKGYRECCVTTPFKLMVKDSAALTRSLNKLMEWDFDSVILAHGDIIQRNGKEIFGRGSYQFFTGATHTHTH